MNTSDNRYEPGITPVKRVFLIAAAVFLLLATIVALQERKRLVLVKTIEELDRAKGGGAQIKTATLNRRQALPIIKSMFVPGSESLSPERLVYGKVDEIRTRLKPDDMTITALEEKGGCVSLQYTLKFANPKYNELLNTISQLQQNVFPFTPVNGIALTQTERNGKGAVEFTISGSVLTHDRHTP